MLSVNLIIKGQIDDQCAGWFCGLIISRSDNDETVLTGIVPDQAALYAVISRLRDMGIQIDTVTSQDLLDQNPP